MQIFRRILKTAGGFEDLTKNSMFGLLLYFSNILHIEHLENREQLFSVM